MLVGLRFGFLGGSIESRRGPGWSGPSRWVTERLRWSASRPRRIPDARGHQRAPADAGGGGGHHGARRSASRTSRSRRSDHGGISSSLIADADLLISVPAPGSASRARAPGRRAPDPAPRIPRRPQVGRTVSSTCCHRARAARRGRRGGPAALLNRAGLNRAPIARASIARGHPQRAPLPAWPTGTAMPTGRAPRGDAWTHVGGARSLRRAARTAGWPGTSGRPRRSAVIAAAAWTPACAAGSAATRAPRSRMPRRPASGSPRPGAGPRPACSGWPPGSGWRSSR